MSGVRGAAARTATGAATSAVLAATLLGACSGGSGGAPEATTSRPGSVTSAGATSTRTPTATTTPRTTSTLGPFPPVLSSGLSPVDGSAIRSLSDLPRAFGCPAGVPPITIPPPTTGGEDAPEALVCASRLARDEALFLWYTGDPDERFQALQAALAKGKYVRGGPNWVAAGMVEQALNAVGGEVYK